MVIVFFAIGSFLFFPNMSIGQGVSIDIEANKEKFDQHTSELENIYTLHKTQGTDDLVEQMQAAAKSRREFLEDLVQKDPKMVLDNALTPESIAEFPQEVQAELEEYVELEGIFETFIEDDFDRGVVRVYHSLVVDNSKYPLHMVSKNLHVKPGSRIKVKGLRIGKRIVVPQREGDKK